MYAEVAWIPVYSGTQVQPQIILDLNYLPDHLSVSYDYDFSHQVLQSYFTFEKLQYPKALRNVFKIFT